MDGNAQGAPSRAPDANGALGTNLEPLPSVGEENGGVEISPQRISAVAHLPTASTVAWGKRMAWLDMPAEQYPGMKIYAWVNYPNKFDTDLQSRNQDIMKSALKRIFVKHNGWVTPEETEKAEQEGRAAIPMPEPTTDEFWEEAPNELVACLLLIINQETVKLPNSLMKNGRS